MLGIGIVDRDDWIAQHAFLRHGAQANHARGCFFRAADNSIEGVGALGQRGCNQISAVIHGDVGLAIEAGEDMGVIGFVVFALDGEHRNIEIAHQAGGDIILR